MAANTGKLAGRTLFITGASRGIGKAIAMKAAKDGANVVIAAKTAAAHPKLPGTIYTAAEEINKAGGKALPCVVDIRNEEQVQKAVDQTVSEFGGIDILVNNASAISLTGTLATDMKKYDLMNSINARGTYLCSRVCLPHLLKGTNPHILNLSPPLNMKPHWFRGHVAYTMAKYGMSMCVLGMAEEFKDQGIAVNALWPRTAIYTAAMEMIGGGDAIKSECRSVDIMSDAAYVILSGQVEGTGKFYIDDEVLKAAGVKDMDQYSIVPGSKLLPDFFLDALPEELEQRVASAGKAAASGGQAAQGGVAGLFQQLQGSLSEALVKEVKASFQFDLSGGDGAGSWHLDLKNGSGAAGQGALEGADCTMIMSTQFFEDMFAGKANATTAFMTGKLKIKGDMGKAMKLQKLMKDLKDNAGAAPAAEAPKAEAKPAAPAAGVEGIFQGLASKVTPELVKDVKAVYQFDLSGADAGSYHLDLKNGSGGAGKGAVEGADVTMSMSTKFFEDMVAGKANPTTAFMTGKLTIKGDMGKAMKLSQLMKSMNAKL